VASDYVYRTIYNTSLVIDGPSVRRPRPRGHRIAVATVRETLVRKSLVARRFGPAALIRADGKTAGMRSTANCC